MRDDRLGKRSAEPRHARQQRRRRGIEIDTNRIDRILHHRVEHLREPVLIDIMLILADADCLGFDLDQFSQRVLQASRDRSEEHTSELQSLMRISYAVFCLKKKTKTILTTNKR